MIPNIKDKYDKEAIITPRMALDYRIQQEGKPNFPAPEGVIFCINRSVLHHILENNDYQQVEGFFADCYLLREENILVISKFGIGAPTTIGLFEELIAYTVTKFVLIGNAGGISPELNVGDVVVCEKAIRDEGISYHYIPPARYADAPSRITSALKETLECDFSCGTNWTTDAFFRETVKEVKEYQKEGVLTVEMEAAAFFAVAQYRNVHAAALFTISDSLAGLKWEPGWHENKAPYEKLFQAAVRTINAL